MNEQKESALLIDILELSKKYPTETFENLADQISNPEFIQNLSESLRQLAKIASINKSQAKSSSRRDFRSSLIKLKESDPEKGKILIEFYDNLQAKTFLSTLKEIRNFASDNGLPPIKAPSRDKAIIPFTKMFLNMSLEEIKSHLQKLESSSYQGDRSLKEWSDIIMGKEES